MVNFIQNAAQIAKDVMDGIDPEISEKYVTVIKFLSDNPEMASSLRGKNQPKPGSEDYIALCAKNFHNGRAPRTPQPPATIPDEMVKVIMCTYFGVPENEIDKAEDWHRLAMGAENIIGDLLERYIAHSIEPHGWVWCSGSLVKAVDFIFCDKQNNWESLQVKNRDNSENSSSSAIRNGTPIKKWHRTFSKRKGDNWENFPMLAGKEDMSEEGFKKYVEDYLEGLRKLST